MQRLCRKLLVISLSLTLGLAPWQTVFADSAVASEQAGEMDQMAGHDGHTPMTHDCAGRHCGHCLPDTDGAGHHCLGGHCVFVALSSQFLLPSEPAVSSGLPDAYGDTASSPPSFLFRPPRV
jgi:hypothetical protein